MIGLCLILKYGSILNPIRDFFSKKEFFKKLFHCCMCMGFWVGILFGIFLSGSIWLIPAWGFYSSAICWFADYLTQIFDKILEGNKSDNITIDK